MVVEYLTPLKLAFDTFRSAIGMMNDIKDTLPSEEQRASVAVAVERSHQQFQIAEVQLAQALGYQLCKCAFPPTIMLAVGTGIGRNTSVKAGEPVFECPKCGANTAGPYHYNRTEGI